MARKRQYSIIDFRGGLNTDVALDHLEDNELTKAINVDLSERGGIKKRQGTAKVNAVSYDGNVTQVFEWPRNDGRVFLMAMIDRGLYRIAEPNGARTLVQGSLKADKISYFFLQDKMYYMDGDSYRIYDGISSSIVSVTKPTITIVEPGTTELPKGTYRCIITFVSAANIETIASEMVDVTMSQAGGKLFWSDLPAPHEDTIIRRLYRTIPGSSNPDAFYLVASLGDEKTNNWLDEKVFEDETHLSELRLENLVSSIEPILKCKYIVRHTKSNRIFAAGYDQDRAALFYSEPNDPTLFKRTSRLYPTTGDGPITGLATFVDAVLVFFENSIWAWLGMDPDIDAVWQKLPTSIGTTAPWSITATTSSLTYLGKGGIYSLSPAVLGYSVEIQPGKDLVFNRAEKKVTNLVRAFPQDDTITAEFDQKTGRFLISDTEQILVLDEGLNAFYTWEGFPVNDIWASMDGDILVASRNYILRFDDSYNDVDVLTGNDKVIKMSVRTKDFGFNRQHQVKAFSRLWLNMISDKSDQYRLKAIVDDEEMFDEEGYTDEDSLVTYTRKLRAFGKRIAFEVEHSGQRQFVLYGLGIELKPVRRYTGKV